MYLPPLVAKKHSDLASAKLPFSSQLGKRGIDIELIPARMGFFQTLPSTFAPLS